MLTGRGTPWSDSAGPQQCSIALLNLLFLRQWIPSAMMPPVICKARSMKRRVRAAQAVHGSAPCKAPDAAALHSPNALQCESERQPKRGRAFKTAPACCWVPLLSNITCGRWGHCAHQQRSPTVRRRRLSGALGHTCSCAEHACPLLFVVCMLRSACHGPISLPHPGIWLRCAMHMSGMCGAGDHQKGLPRA